MKKICIVSGCYNEEENIEELYRQLTEQTNALNQYEWEMIFADNCSSDRTADLLRSIASRDSRVKIILNQANYGPDRSNTNALFSADADAVIMMASDLEDPPALIPAFVKAWEEGYKVIMGQYTSKKENKLLSASRVLYYNIIERFSEYELPKNVTGFGLYDMDVINQIKELGEYNVVLRFLCTELGYTIKYIPFEKPTRKKGKSSYSLAKYYKYAVETLVLTSHAPLHIASFLGFIVSFISFIFGIIYLVYKLKYWYEFNAGSAPVIIGMFFLGGIQLFFIGVIGEYLSSGIKRVTKRPFVIEKERINFENYGKSGKQDYIKSR